VLSAPRRCLAPIPAIEHRRVVSIAFIDPEDNQGLVADGDLRRLFQIAVAERAEENSTARHRLLRLFHLGFNPLDRSRPDEPYEPL
jgi:hypothetical protein